MESGCSGTHGRASFGRMAEEASFSDRIVIDPNVRFGKPTVRGTRISVADVLGWLAAGMSEAEICADFPKLTTEDIRACLKFAAERERRLAS